MRPRNPRGRRSDQEEAKRVRPKQTKVYKSERENSRNSVEAWCLIGHKPTKPLSYAPGLRFRGMLQSFEIW